MRNLASTLLLIVSTTCSAATLQAAAAAGGGRVALGTVPGDLVPLPFAVCVVLMPEPHRVRLAPDRPKFDSYWPTYEEAAARRHEILTSPEWVVNGDEVDEEDGFPLLQIRKVTVDESADGSVCQLPPPAARRPRR